DPIRGGAPHAARTGFAFDLRELGAQLGDPVAYLAPIELGGALSGAAPADPAAFAISPAAGLAQPRRDVREPRDLHLEPGLAAARVALEDREDHGGAVEHLGARRALEVARLRGSELVVDEHQSRAVVYRAVRFGPRGIFLRGLFRLTIRLVVGVS